MKLYKETILAVAATFTLGACTSTQHPQGAGTAQPVASGATPAETIGIELATSKTEYRIGEPMEFTVKPTTDCYLGVWIKGSWGAYRQIYPNAHAAPRVFRGGVRESLPGSEGFQFTVDGPAGNNQLIVFASTEPIAASSRPPAAPSRQVGSRSGEVSLRFHIAR